MATLPVTVNRAPADIGATLSAAMAAENPVGPVATRGRGTVSLCNTSGNARLYVALQDTAPDTSVPGIPVRVGEWFPEDLQITPAGGVWAWASRDDATMTALVTGWS